MCRGPEEKNALNGRAKKTHRVLMWAPPRSLSTCVERAFIEHPAIHVQHEPFGTPFYWSEDAQSGREASGGLRKPTYASVADDVLLSIPPPGKDYIFSKNLSYYVAPHCIEQLADWEAQAVAAGDTVVHCFMMRHPAKAVSSLYYKSCIDNEGTGYTHFDAVEAGYEQMWDILRYIDQTGARTPTLRARPSKPFGHARDQPACAAILSPGFPPHPHCTLLHAPPTRLHAPSRCTATSNH